MLDISIVNETSPEANWNWQTGRQADRQADGQTNLCIGRLRLQKSECGIPQPSSGIAGDDVLKCGMPEPLPETRPLTNWKPKKHLRWNLSVTLLSQAKKSECGIVQPSSCIARYNVPNKMYVRATARNQGFSQLEA